MFKQVWLRWCMALVVGIVLVATNSKARATCAIAPLEHETKTGLVLHLGPDCTVQDREDHVVRGDAIIKAITQGGGVDLVGVIVRGDVLFGRLDATSKSGGGPRTSGSAEPVDGGEPLVVRGRMTIRDSVVLGELRHRSAVGKLKFEGPVDFQGSRFKEVVDLSRSIFQDTLELSRATFEKEALFVQGDFSQGLGCRDTKFGPSTRFHRSIFHGPVDCTGALFDGMAELLEVNFEGPATFDRARFGLGTGFSGSRFKRQAHFSDAIFSRETFFGFAIFEGKTVFAGAQFLGHVDFSQAEFKEWDDLAAVRFDRPPDLSQTKRIVQNQPAGFIESKGGQYTVTVVLLIVAAGLVGYLLKMK